MKLKPEDLKKISKKMESSTNLRSGAGRAKITVSQSPQPVQFCGSCTIRPDTGAFSTLFSAIYHTLLPVQLKIIERVWNVKLINFK